MERIQTVLVVEDDEDIADLIATVLQSHPYEVSIASSAASAKLALQRGYPRSYACCIVFIQTRIDVRRAGTNANAVVRGDARHFERRRKVLRTVVDTRQHVAVKIDHRGELLRTKLTTPRCF